MNDDQAIKDQEACEKEIADICKKYDCSLVGRAIIITNAVDVQIVVVKNPPDQANDAPAAPKAA